MDHPRSSLVLLRAAALTAALTAAGCETSPAEPGPDLPADAEPDAASTADGSNDTGATDGSEGSEDTGPPPPSEMAACEGTTLFAAPDDPAAPGPWSVGARTVTVAGLTTEVWYPAAPGAEAGLEQVSYDLRLEFRPGDQGKIPDQDAPRLGCDCYRDLPLDEAHGPYPVVLYVHGTAGFRHYALPQMTHWASRGFVVVAANHPKIQLSDALDFDIAPDQAAEARALLAAIRVTGGELAFLQGAVDTSRMAVTGHSAGGAALAELGDEAGVRVLIPMASRGTAPGAHLESTLILGAEDDATLPYFNQFQAFEASPARKRLVGLRLAGHLAFTVICAVGREQGGMLQIAIDHGIEVNDLIATLATDGCLDGQLPAEDGWEIIDYATAAVLEETLHCSPTAAARLAAIGARYPAVLEVLEEL